MVAKGRCGGEISIAAAVRNHRADADRSRSSSSRRTGHHAIDLNGTENGVLLPTRRFPGWKGAIHRGGSPAYYKGAVRELLDQATSKEDALNLLEQIREKLLNGDWQLNAG
jgi:hypothetical protein